MSNTQEQRLQFIYQQQEQIDYWRKDEKYQNEEIDRVKTELKQYIIQMKTEEKRQNVLKELVSLLKGEMSKIQIKQVEVNQKETAQLNHAIESLQHDIDEISRKKNQQIARISILKQNINQSRSERVVYSNLFKKIQKQLKEDQQTYKNLLMKATQAEFDSDSEQTKKIKINTEQQNKSNNKLKDSGEQTSFSTHPGIIPKQQNHQIITHHFPITNTTKNQQKKLIDKPKKKLGTQHKHTQKPISQNNETTMMNKSFLVQSKIMKYNENKQNMENYLWQMQDLIKVNDRIKQLTACDSTQEIIQLSNTILQKNEKLQEHISQISDKIHYFRKQIKNISYETTLYYAEATDDQTNFGNQSTFNIQTRRKKSLHLESYEFGKQNLGIEVQSKSKRKNSRKGQFSSRFSQTEKTSSQTIQQFIQLYNLLNFPEKSGQYECNQQQHISIDPLNMNNSELEEQCKFIDAAVTELYQWMNSNDNILPATMDHNHSLATINNQTINEGNDVQFMNYSEKFNNVDEEKGKSGNNSRQTSGFLNAILNRMDKFGSCEKLLDRDGFFGEYQKELTKKTKYKSKKS